MSYQSLQDALHDAMVADALRDRDPVECPECGGTGLTDKDGGPCIHCAGSGYWLGAV